jgi:Ca2+-binding RTX toxin-like protein
MTRARPNARNRNPARLAAALCAALGLVLATAATSEAAVTCGGLTPTINENNATGPVVIKGTGNPDVIVGSRYSDTIASFSDDDIVCGGGGHDSIRSGSGDDEVYGSSGSDTIKTGSGDDEVDPGPPPGPSSSVVWDDRVTMGDGSDYLHGATDQLIAFMGGGGDRVDVFGEAYVEVHGESGDDNLKTFSLFQDFARGEGGSDIVETGMQRGSSWGGHGDDTLTGNTCFGGDFAGASDPGDRFFSCATVE